MPDQDHLESFIANSFRSVWALEVLRFLTENEGESYTAQELITHLRVSDAVVSQSVDNLSSAGLVVVDSHARVALHQGSPELARQVRSAIEFYRKSPDKVRRLIVAQSSPGVTAFADAFKLRRD
jgi:DNA-binding IclR family transcriptional regulator